ncbi:EamA-like transporter family protein [Aliiroseovarius sediminilitoris]|uniref:EamA-like transporter family protein n=1 Tax=Aliiroseovarius sediminilitoris TaxID=1173584 RepID=A0A1I0PSQ6_9RHOB|nr:DMT family transporter [Aliiroseovarius sediminilitoris]SEW17413.1 EamA-like transporter family protein [Aliiroseovarius sediminilitoris]
MTPTVRAAFWMTGAIASFSAMAIAGRAVSHQLDTFELMLYRSCVGFVIVLTILIARGRQNEITMLNAPLHVVRNLAHFAGQNLWFFALTAIPLAQVFALEFTSPLWVAALSPLVLGERLTVIRAISAAVGFVGIVIIAQPGSGAVNSVGLGAAALSAICFAFTAMLTRRLTRSETTLAILLWLTSTQLVFGMVTAGYDGDVTLPSLATAPWLVLIGCAGLLAHACLTTALSLAPASVVIPIDFTRLPLIALIGAVFYDEPIGWALVLGGSLIVVANLANIRAEATPRAS